MQHRLQGSGLIRVDGQKAVHDVVHIPRGKYGTVVDLGPCSV